ncbi:response regulator [Segetibacter sp.]|jgi:CRP/FNR family cyclic AMP-dependent transcriptional regulator|uniref:response regulator n=1 Tax=Segetibacter sp. TaxID=2231182 RepID=UPI00261C8F21|nr:response regulator [Segetibacter sp.]MCW3080535.1 response regulator [Segetibacter sp.]
MKKILVIEDNTEVRENTAEIIELSNYIAITAENGKTGVELALRELPDLIICDIMMPVLDGYGVYHSLSKHKETAAIPFIFLTAKSEKGDFRRGMEMGADDYITKPYDGIELLNAIEVRLKKIDLLKQQYAGIDGIRDFIATAQKTGKVELTSVERDTYTYNKKHILYKEGQRPRVVYHVIKGKVKASKANDEGKEFITSIYSTGDFFGYTAILEDVNYKEEAVVLEETELMLIPREDFMQLVSNDMQIAQSFIKIITKNVVEKEENLLNLAYGSLRKKVAYGLIQLYDKYKIQEELTPVLNLSRENMAQSIGIATESLIRTLGDFKDEKLIEIQTGKVIILDENKLRHLPY